LAKEALFEGVGMYWTLEDGHDLWREQVHATQSGKTPPAQPEVSKAWGLIADIKSEEFFKERAKQYFGADDDETVVLSQQVFTALNTYAAQLGLVMTWASLRQLHPSLQGDEIANVMIEGINAALTSGPNKSRDRRAIFAKDLPDREKTFNKLPKMDTPFASYFRYFWIELLMLDDNQPKLAQAGLDLELLKKTRRTARWLYLGALATISANSLKQSSPELSDAERNEKGRAIVAKSMAKAFHHWFNLSTQSVEQELLSDLQTGTSGWLSKQEQAETVPEPLNGGNGAGENEEAVAALAEEPLPEPTSNGENETQQA
jgi:hypothetical protein